jgi:hypothetical protein
MDSQRAANYVLASGEQMGAVVSVVPMSEPKDYSGTLRADLALAESPSLKYQTLAPYSEGKEPGTWHWV